VFLRQFGLRRFPHCSDGAEMRPVMPNLEELKELNRKLAMLLEDPQPGLFTWKRHLWDVLEKIAEFAK